MTKYGKTIKSQSWKKNVFAPRWLLFSSFIVVTGGQQHPALRGHLPGVDSLLLRCRNRTWSPGVHRRRPHLLSHALVHVLALRIKLSEEEELTNGKQGHEVQRTGRGQGKPARYWWRRPRPLWGRPTWRRYEVNVTETLSSRTRDDLVEKPILTQNLSSLITNWWIINRKQIKRKK